MKEPALRVNLDPAKGGHQGGSVTLSSLLSASVHPGGVADSVSRWVFRHRLPPEELKAFHQKSDEPDEGEKPENPEVLGTAGQLSLSLSTKNTL